MRQQTSYEQAVGIAAGWFLVLVALIAIGFVGCAQPRADVTMIVAFGTPTCLQCEIDKPSVYELGVPVHYFDGNQNPDIANQFQVTAYPTYFVIGPRQEILLRTNYFVELKSFLGK